MSVFTKEELEFEYGKMPELLEVKKMNSLLNKKNNKYNLIDDVYTEVLKWLELEDLNYIEQNIILDNNESLKSININDNVLMIVIDDYTIFNKAKLGKDIASKLHKIYQEKGFRVVWCKKFEWEDLKKRVVMKSLILHALGRTTKKTYARKTVASVVENKELREFLDDNSFYGFRGAGTAVCLRDKKTDEILEVMTFGHAYYAKNRYGDNCVECIRAATKAFTMVVGGMSKLMNFYLDTFGDDIDSIVFYVDDAHYQSKTMDFLGFEYSHFSGNGVHNVFPETGSVFMRTPALHKEIKFLQAKNEIYAVPDVGNTVFVYKKDKQEK